MNLIKKAIMDFRSLLIKYMGTSIGRHLTISFFLSCLFFAIWVNMFLPETLGWKFFLVTAALYALSSFEFYQLVMRNIKPKEYFTKKKTIDTILDIFFGFIGFLIAMVIYFS
jgi:hypothetical protein